MRGSEINPTEGRKYGSRTKTRRLRPRKTRPRRRGQGRPGAPRSPPRAHSPARCRAAADQRIPPSAHRDWYLGQFRKALSRRFCSALRRLGCGGQVPEPRPLVPAPRSSVSLPCPAPLYLRNPKRDTQPLLCFRPTPCSRESWERQRGGKGAGDTTNMAAEAVTKTVAATATAAALNKAVGVTRCGCQVVSSWLPARTAVTRLSRVLRRSGGRREPGVRDGRAASARDSAQAEGRAWSVGRSAGSRPRALLARTRGMRSLAPGAPQEQCLRWRCRRAMAWRLRGRMLPLALTGGREGAPGGLRLYQVPGQGLS